MSSVEPKKLSASEKIKERQLKREAERLKEKNNNELLRKRQHILSPKELQSFFSREDVRNVFVSLNVSTDGHIGNLLVIREWHDWCQERVESEIRGQEFGMLIYEWEEIKEMISHVIDRLTFEEISNIEWKDKRILSLVLLHKKEYSSRRGLSLRDIEIWCERHGASL